MAEERTPIRRFAQVLCPAVHRHAALLEALEALLQERAGVGQYAQRQLLLSAGQAVTHLYFVESGLVRGYFYDDASGRAITLHLWGEHTLAVPVQSFFLQRPSDVYLEVMTDSQLLSLSYQHLMDAATCLPELQASLQHLVLKASSFHRQRAIALLTRSAWQRYLDLLQTHPRIEHQVSKEVIASYLGITPQSLSRLLRENGHP